MLRKEGRGLREDSQGWQEGMERKKICVNVCNMSSCLVFLLTHSCCESTVYHPYATIFTTHVSGFAKP
jgi:hypothetical protein